MTSPRSLVQSAARVLCIITALCSSIPVPVIASPLQPFPFAPGEKLRYDVFWAGIKAAEATLEIMPMASLDGRPAWHFTMTAHTTGIAAAVYPVHDRIDSWSDAGMTHALLFTENARKRFGRKKLSITFDWLSNTAYSQKNGKKRTVELKTGAFDPLSIFYFFRMQELQENLELTRPVADRKRCQKGVANVRGRQKASSGGREWDTWLVEPDLSQIEGVFEKHPGARMQIWVSADERRIPVLVKSKVAVGSFTAELVSIEYPGPPSPPGGTAQEAPALN